MTPAARRALRAARAFGPAEEARQRLTKRYMPDAVVPLRPEEALHFVASAVRHAAEPLEHVFLRSLAPPDAATVLDGLMQLDETRHAVEVKELRLITYARHLGVTWERIGEALGYGVASRAGMERDARIKGAQSRFTALAKRHPHLAVKFDEQMEALRQDGAE